MMPDSGAGRRLTFAKKLCTDGWNHRVDGASGGAKRANRGVTDSQKNPLRSPLHAAAEAVFLLSRAPHRQVKKVDGTLLARRAPSGAAENA